MTARGEGDPMACPMGTFVCLCYLYMANDELLNEVGLNEGNVAVGYAVVATIRCPREVLQQLWSQKVVHETCGVLCERWVNGLKESLHLQESRIVAGVVPVSDYIEFTVHTFRLRVFAVHLLTDHRLTGLELLKLDNPVVVLVLEGQRAADFGAELKLLEGLGHIVGVVDFFGGKWTKEMKCGKPEEPQCDLLE